MNHAFESIDRERFDHADPEKTLLDTGLGLTEEIVRMISKEKKEPEWMLQKRLQGYQLWMNRPMPGWGPDLSKLDVNKIRYYVKPDAKASKNWEEVPAEMKKTFERIGIPEAEQKFLAGAGAQYDSEVVYHKLKKEWEDKGVIFEDMDVAVQKYPNFVKKYFMTCIPITTHKFIHLHAAVWSGGTFIYVPPGVKLGMPLQAYFRMNAKKGGQFEHTLIIVDKGAELHYIEGCFTKGNLVTCNSDYKPIEEIRKKEKVLTSEGEFKKTKGIQVMPYTGYIYTIELYGDSTQKIEVTAEHPFLYVDKLRKRERNKTFTPRWNTPKFFKKGDYLVLPINREVKTEEFHKFNILKAPIRGRKLEKHAIRVPLINEFFRLVGYYLAEGSISSNSYLNFSFGSKEREYIEDVKYCLKKVFGIEKILEMHHKKNHGTSVVVCSVELVRIFKQLGDKCDRKALLSWMMRETPEHQKEIIRGWYRGDGNYYNKIATCGQIKEILRVNTTSEKLTRQGKDVLLRLGVVGFLNKRERYREGRKTIYTLGATGESLVKLAEILNINVKKKLNGKNRASLFGLDEKFAYLPIKNITKREVVNFLVYNLGVEEHETYTVGGVAVHNCSAPVYTESSLHAGCVEIFVMEGARCRYSSVENWSKNTYNLNTKRAIVEKNGVIEWVGGNLGSGVTMLYPCSILKGDNSKADHLGIAFANTGQNQDVGAKAIHIGKNTSSNIRSKSISKGGGINTFRGLISVKKGASGAKAHMQCDALIFGTGSVSNTIPSLKIDEEDCQAGHEATVGRISEEHIFYLMSRGLTEEEAKNLIVAGFIEPIAKELPLEYAVELNKLIAMEMENSNG